MSDLIYQSSKPVLVQNLKNLSGILKKAASDAKVRRIEPAVLLGSRLAPDMFPLIRQVQLATDHATGCCARLAGVENPVFADDEQTFVELEARIKRAQSFLRGLKSAQFVGSEDKKIVVQLPVGTLIFSGLEYLNGWALPNFYFHYSASYNILRHNGVGLGKIDYLGAMPGVQMKGKIAKMMGAKPATRGSKASKR